MWMWDGAGWCTWYRESIYVREARTCRRHDVNAYVSCVALHNQRQIFELTLRMRVQ